MSMFSDIVSAVVSTAVTAFTGSPMLGQLASSFVSSLIGDSGDSGNSAFDQVFNGAWGNGLQSVFA